MILSHLMMVLVEKELFSHRHSSLCTVVEPAFALLKKGICVLDAKPYWNYRTQVDEVLEDCVLHNHIIGVDPNDNISCHVKSQTGITTKL